MDEGLPLPAHKQAVSDLVGELKHPEAAGAAGVSALVAALAAGLTAKVATLTAGREGFEAVTEEMQRVANRAALLSSQLTQAIDSDPQAQLRLTQAFHLPQGTPDEGEIRRSCLDLALKNVVQVPVNIAQLALEVLGLAETVSRYGNPIAAAEAGLAMATAISSVKGALAAATGGLRSVTDDEWTETTREAMARMLEKVMELEGELAELPLTV
ncbi:MAG: cyclodeaminase/cyclohydrolase family protein [Candidatus Sericytochromatia bacterium]|uniref:Cyclodeaminase/cyclohydrolase family protein n=1 Tax=Candidatus Tanganyikabacteria bacterium TaxID=2961651 RepID=A0A937X928_9BACT|nr:cyclodeaminase/cyclohydrolase family protein [Candidatus Tanganyikabacteria bacterium]